MSIAKQKKTSAPVVTSPTEAVGAHRKRWFRLLAVILIPVGFLLSLEGVLRLSGYGYSTGFFRKQQTAGRTVWIENRDFGRRFFPPGLVRYAEPIDMVLPKPPNTLRIIVFGESAAMGDPDLKFGLPRMLEVLLRQRFPDRQIEVINVAMVAINSHVILPIARDCANKQADLWVIYMGNNEIIGPFGSASVFSATAPPLAMVRAALWVKTTRVGQLLDAALQRLRQANNPLPEWGGMEMMANLKVRHDSSATQRVYRHFERNLRDLLTVGTRAGVPIILCTVGTNLKDCGPFASLHRPGLTSAELVQWQTSYEAGAAFQQQGDFKAAKAEFQRAAGIDNEFAALAFRMAECCRLSGEAGEAAKLFRQSRDEDALQFRADEQINQIIRQSADAFAKRGTWLLDADKLFMANSPQGLIGAEHFYEHVHLTPEGNYLLARGVAEKAAEALSLRGGTGDWALPAECFAPLGLTDWNRYDALGIILDRVQGAPFTNQVDHAEELARINEQITRYKAATKPAELRLEVRQLSRLVTQYPQSPALRWNLAALLQSAGDATGAEEQWRVLMILQPRAAFPVFNLAELVDRLGRHEEACSLYGKCLQLDPGYYPARYALGSLCLGMERLPEAIHHLKLALQQRPQAVEARLACADALAKAHDVAGAQKQWLDILRLDPRNSTARKRLNEVSGESSAP